MKKLIPFFILIYVLIPKTALALTPTWEQCLDGAEIVHCETFNCPLGDTDGDNACTPSDKGASISDIRNDALCALPASSCGAIHYFSADGGLSCDVYAVEKTSVCDIETYAVQNKTINVDNVLARAVAKGEDGSTNETDKSTAALLGMLGTVPPFLGLLILSKRPLLGHKPGQFNLLTKM